MTSDTLLIVCGPLHKLDIRAQVESAPTGFRLVSFHQVFVRNLSEVVVSESFRLPCLDFGILRGGTEVDLANTHKQSVDTAVGLTLSQ